MSFARQHYTAPVEIIVIDDGSTDGNARIGGLVRLIYTPEAIPGLNFQLRARRVVSDFPGVGYFAPERLNEGTLLAQYRITLPGDQWTLTGTAGGGLQKVNSQDSTQTYQADLRVHGWFTEHFGVEGKAGCTNSGGFNTSAAGNGYRYCFGQATLIGSW